MVVGRIFWLSQLGVHSSLMDFAASGMLRQVLQCWTYTQMIDPLEKQFLRAFASFTFGVNDFTSLAKSQSSWKCPCWKQCSRSHIILDIVCSLGHLLGARWSINAWNSNIHLQIGDGYILLLLVVFHTVHIIPMHKLRIARSWNTWPTFPPLS